MSSIPICMCGKQPRLARDFDENMMPEYDVVYHFQSRAAFNEEFPLLLAGKKIDNHQTSIGSNLERYINNETPRIPQAIFLGADFTEPEILEMSSSSYPSMPWLASAPERRWESKKIADANRDGPGPLELVAERAKECLRENGLVHGNEANVKAGLWRY